MIKESQQTEYLCEKLRSVNFCLSLNRKNQQNLQVMIDKLTKYKSSLASFSSAISKLHHKNKKNNIEFYAFNLPASSR